jgi:ribosomal protein L9
VGINDKLAPIYGSVTIHDVAVEMRKAMDTNDEARKVTINQDDLKFVGLPASAEADADRIKHIGDFAVELKLKNMTEPITRTVRVSPQNF